MVNSHTVAMLSVLLIAGAVVANEHSFDDDITASIVGNWLGSAFKDTPTQGLVQTGSSDFVSDYPGCTLGYFWCMKLKAANISSYHASRLTFGPIKNNTNFFEWALEGKPTCVAQGPSYHACELGNVLFCAGASDYGRAEDQAEAVRLAIDNNGIHPQCPGCAQEREIPHSPSYCLNAKGEECVYICDDAFVASGPRVCQENGTFSSGTCVIRAVDTDTNEMMSPSPLPFPSPSPAPSVVVPTAQDVNHENWTMYEQSLEFETTAEYRKLLSESLCLYLLDLENDFHSRHFEPKKPLRSGLFPAARAADCAWVHEEVYQRAAERKHRIPIRGDHGPWPRKLTPNVVHVRVTGGEVIALNIDLQNTLGKDLYDALAKRLSIRPDSFSLYFGVHPINEEAPLKLAGIKHTDTLIFTPGQRLQRVSDDQVEGKKISWRVGAVSDGDRGVLAP